MGCVTTMKITDKKRLSKLVSFLAMSDGSIHNSRNSKNYLFSFSATEDHMDIIKYVEGVINNITSTKIYSCPKEAPRKTIYKVYTPTHPYFNALHERIYVGSYKSIDNHSLKQLDYEALAIWYMCDGCLGKSINKKTGKVNYSTTINLCRLSYGDLLLVKKAIKDKLDLEFNVVKTNRKYFTLRLRTKDLEKFIDGISPYILDSFKYKIDFRTVNPIDTIGGDIV